MTKETIYTIKEQLDKEFSDSIITVVAEKTGWLLLKDRITAKTFGCIRSNKLSFITLYIDTKEDVVLENLSQSPYFSSIDIKTRNTGNFNQNKFKFKTEDQMLLVSAILKLVTESKYIKTDNKIRS